MEPFFSWLLQNVAWDTLKKALPKGRQHDVVVFRRALSQAQERLAELEQDRKLLETLVDQRDRFHAELIIVKRQLAEAQISNHKLEQKLKSVQPKRRPKQA